MKARWQGGVLASRSERPPPARKPSPIPGKFPLTGAPSPACSQSPGGISLGPRYGALQVCNGNPGWTFSFDVVPGQYDVYVTPSVEFAGVRQVVQKGLVVDGDLTGLQFDLVEYPVHGTLTLDGAPVYCHDLADVGSLYPLVDLTQSCGPLGNSFDIYRPPGSIQIGLWTDASNRPTSQSVATNFLQAPPFQLAGPLDIALDVRTTTVSGTVTLNGAPITAPCWGASVQLSGGGGTSHAPVNCDGTGWTFSAKTGQADYEIEVEGDLNH